MAFEPTNYASLIPNPQPITAPLDALRNEQLLSATKAAAIQEAQQQQRAAALAASAQQEAINNPSQENYRRFLLAAPQYHEAIQGAYNGLTEEDKNSTLRDISAVDGYIRANQPDQAAAILQNHITAAQKLGQDVRSYQAVLNTIKTDPKSAQFLTGTMLAATAGADKLASTQASFGQEARAQAGFPAEQALTQAKTAQALAEAKKAGYLTVKDSMGADTVLDVNKLGGGGAAATGAAGGAQDPNGLVTPDFVQKVLQDENGGKATGKNPNSSASGAAQFVDGTWTPLISQLHPELVKGKTPQQVLDLRNNPQLAAEATAAYAQQNAPKLAAAGLPVNQATLALAHRLGPGGAQAVLQAQGDAPLSSVLPADVIKANPQYAKMTAGKLGQQFADRFGAGASAGPGSQAVAYQSSDGQDQLLSPDSIAMVGQQYLSLGPSALQNLGQGKIGVRNKNAIMNWVAQTAKAAGTSNPELVARFAQNRANTEALGKNTSALTAITSSEGTLTANLDFAQQLAKRGLGPTGVPLLDTPINKLRSQLGSVDAKNLDNLLKTSGDEYARILTMGPNGGGGATSVEATKQAQGLLNNGMTLGQLIGAINVAKTEAENRRISYANENKRLVSEISGTPYTPQANANPAPSGPQSAPGGAPVKVRSIQEAQALPAGTIFLTPDGRQKVR